MNNKGEVRVFRDASEQWLRENKYSWMSDDQWECFEMLADLCRGSHHIGGKVKPSGSGIQISLQYGFYAATFDYDGLTRAVVMAHDRCIRFEIYPSSPRTLGLRLHKRHSREGGMSSRHPTLEEALKNLRKEDKKGNQGGDA